MELSRPNKISSQFLRMGVINVTPNSFSDGGLSDQMETFSQKLEYFFPHFDVIDIGAESTAPNNTSISEEEEYLRLERTLVAYFLKGGVFPKILSLDTYRVKTAFLVAEFLYKKMNWQGELWWNDISGKYDQDVTSFLEMYPQAKYIYAHNLSPERSLSGRHMEYVWKGSNDELFDHLKSYFVKIGENDRVIFDPCFGFSKTKEQNLFLWKSLPELFKNFSKKQHWLLGISRKSFLRDPFIGMKSEDLLFETEMIQVLALRDLLTKVRSSQFIFRSHRLEIFRAIDFFQSKIE